MARQIIGIILLVFAAIVAIHTIVEPLYFDSSLSGSGYNEGVWAIINPLTAIGFIAGIILSFLSKRSLDRAGGMNWDRLAASALFYGFLFVGIMFFWNWFNLISPRFTAIHPATIQMTWIIIDAGFPVLAGSLGMRLYRETSD